MNEQRGTKRVCATCGTRFYDLLSKPVCPKCKAEFIIPVPPPPRRPTKTFIRQSEPTPIVAGSADDLPEIDDEETITPSDDEDADDSPAEEATESE